MGITKINLNEDDIKREAKPHIQRLFDVMTEYKDGMNTDNSEQWELSRYRFRERLAELGIAHLFDWGEE